MRAEHGLMPRPPQTYGVPSIVLVQINSRQESRLERVIIGSLTPKTTPPIATVIPPNNAKDMSGGNVEQASGAVQRTISAERSLSYLNYRVRNLPAGYSLAETKTALKTALKLGHNSALWIGSIAPDLEREGFQVATITFKGCQNVCTRLTGFIETFR